MFLLVFWANVSKLYSGFLTCFDIFDVLALFNFMSTRECNSCLHWIVTHHSIFIRFTIQVCHLAEVQLDLELPLTSVFIQQLL